MISRYKIVVVIDLLHDYYSNGKCSDFNLSPSAETSTLLKKGQMLYKVADHKLLILAKVDDTGKPIVDFSSFGKLVFYMELKQPGFMTVTNLDTGNLSRFYFTNLNQNSSGGPLSLSASVSIYDVTTTYTPGQMADDGAGNIFECIKTSTGNGTGNTAFWAPRAQVQYVNEEDLISFTSRVTNFELAVAASTFVIKVFGLNASSDLYNKIVLSEVSTADAVATTKQVQVDMTGLPPGKYKVLINGQQFNVYMDDTAVYSNVIGIIELFTHLPGTNPFSLLDAFGKLKEFTYALRFANRRAYWKYITPRQQVNNVRITDSLPAVYPFESFSNDMIGAPTRKDYFLSKEPLLLSESASLNNFELELVGLFNSSFPSAPKPDPSAAGMLTQASNDFYCTIFLNY